MICYRDKTFCSFDDCKNFNECNKALTDEIKEQAIKWWGNNQAPISQYINKPDCFVEKEWTVY